MSTKEPKFKPKPGQIDYTNISRAPVINCVVQYRNKILIVQRNSNMKFYPDYWNGISGFLDDGYDIKRKVKEELKEEVKIDPEKIISIEQGKPFEQGAPKYNKTWVVHPVLVKVKSNKIKLDWEAQNYRWVRVREAKNFNLLPGFDQVLVILFSRDPLRYD